MRGCVRQKGLAGMNNRLRLRRKQRSVLFKKGATYKRKCPVCGYDIKNNPFAPCFHCGWECDPICDTRPDYAGGPNKMSLNEARAAYKNGEPVY